MPQLPFVRVSAGIALSCVVVVTARSQQPGASTQESAAGIVSRAIRYETYASPDACIAAVHRIEFQTGWESPERDTMPVDSQRTPSAAIDIARYCSARFSPDSVLEKSLNALQQLAILANDDARAERVVQRRIALGKLHPVSEQAILLNEVVDQWLNAHPSRFAQADTLFARWPSIDTTMIQPRLWSYTVAVRQALLARDIPRAKKYAQHWVTLARRLPKDQIESGIVIECSAMYALLMLPGHGDIDTLLAARYRDTLTAAFGNDPATDAARLVGQLAPPLSGAHPYDIASRDTNPTALRPVSLVVFLASQCGSHCASDYAVLHRIATRFGAQLHITTMLRTNGYLRNVLYPSPSDEADAIHQYFANYFHIPGGEIVEVTPFTHRPPPDRRRVNGVNPTFERYHGSLGISAVNGYLTDRNGRIVWPPLTIAADNEPFLTSMIAGVIDPSGEGGEQSGRQTTR